MPVIIKLKYINDLTSFVYLNVLYRFETQLLIFSEMIPATKPMLDLEI